MIDENLMNFIDVNNKEDVNLFKDTVKRNFDA